MHATNGILSIVSVSMMTPVLEHIGIPIGREITSLVHVMAMNRCIVSCSILYLNYFSSNDYLLIHIYIHHNHSRSDQ